MPDPSPEPDNLEIDGDIIRGSWATCAAKVRLNPVRWLWYKRETHPFAQVWMLLTIAIVCSCALRWWVLAVILVLPLLPLSSLLWRISRQVAVIYQNAALTAGIVVSVERLEFISMANMSTGGGEEAYALKRTALFRLPGYPEEVGTLFPCVSGFQDGPTLFLWGDFEPQPLSLGTGNKKLLQARRSKLGEDAFTQLHKVFERGVFPRQAKQLVWLNEKQTGEVPPPIPAV